MLTILLSPSSAMASTWTIIGSNSFAGTVGVEMPINDVQLTGGNPDDIIPVKLRVTSGTLAMSITTGLTFTGGISGATLRFSGTRTNINNALETLTYTRGSTGTDTLEVSLVEPNEVFFEDNGHLYEYITYNSTWAQANSNAQTLTRYGATGYLVTVTSHNENEFVRARLTNAGWMGASDSVSEGVWRWVTGPENGVQFWSGLSNGSAVGGNYENWANGEPNDSGGEDCAQFLSGGTGEWNDLPCSSFFLPGYVAEFGAEGDMPEVEAKNINITTSSLPIVSTLSPLDNSTHINPNSNFVVTFSKSVFPELTGNITIHKSSDDSVVETIPANDARITGSGSAVITINPNTNLEDTTSYYINIGNDAFRDSLNNYFSGISNTTTWNFTTGDFTAPVISETIPISSPISDSTPEYVFTVNEVGIISYGGSCISNFTNASVGVNTINFNSLSDGTYSNCTIIVTDSASNISNTLNVSAFTVDTLAPVLIVINQVPSTVTSSSTSFDFSTTESGNYTISSCGDSSVVNISGTSVNISNLTSGKNYTCTIYSTDSAGNISNSLTVGPFTASFGGIVPLVFLQTLNKNLQKTQAQNLSNINTPTQNQSSNIENLKLFLVNMRQGNSNNEIKRLQIFLRDIDPTIYPESRITGYFGPLTYKAVVRFQEKYTQEILVPIGTIKGTGYVGENTRNKINQLVSQNNIYIE